MRLRSLLTFALLSLAAAGCKAIAPSNDRVWSPDQAVLPYAIDTGDSLCIRNVRNCQYRAVDDYTVDYYDKYVDLSKVETVDFIVCPFQGVPILAHTMLSFGLGNGEYLAVSVEIRKEKGEAFSPLKGSLRQYEIMYVIGDERDLVKLRTNFRGEDVYVYRTTATPEQAQRLFVDVLNRVNKLHASPEFYDTLTNNCTNNIVYHVNRIKPSRVPYSLQVLFPGMADKYAKDLGLLATPLPIAEARQRARVNELALQFGDSPDFSRKIRQ